MRFHEAVTPRWLILVLGLLCALLVADLVVGLVVFVATRGGGREGRRG